VITLRDVTLRRGAKVVLERTNLSVHAGEKVGLVGRNGAGKSSLFALLAGRLHADKGDVELPPRWRVGEVAQSMPETADGATEFVLQGDDVLMRAQAQLIDAESSGDGHAIAEAHLALEEAGTFDARARAQALLLGLGFRVEQLDAPVNSFSGGWRMRLQLARALMAPSDALLLDEPTNHLDLDALVWLESWLGRYPGTLIVISHDREFLDAITRVTLHVDAARVDRYTGNYSAFEDARAERIEQAQSAFAKQQERIAHLQRFIDRFKAKATKAKQAQSRVKALARMEKLAPVLTALLFLLVFAHTLRGRVEIFPGVDYAAFLVPGLAMMSVLQNAFANGSSSLMQSKMTGNIIFVLLPPFSHREFFAAYLLASVARGLVVGAGVFLATFWLVPMRLDHPLWALAFALASCGVLGVLGVIAGIYSDKVDELATFQNFVVLPLTFLSGVFYSIHSLPPFWQWLSHLNPIFYMVDGFRYGFFGQSDISPWLSLAIVSASFFALSFFTLWLLRSGYKLRN